MKTKIFLIVVLAFSAITFAQTTSVPDTNFEHYLETHSKVDLSVVAVGDANSMGNGIDGDHVVTTANIASRTSIDLTSLNIADLTGLEDFSALSDLWCSNNNISTLILPNVTSLAALNIDGNNLTTITFPNSLISIGEFTCNNNQLTSINFNNVTYINFFVGDNNPFTTVDFSTTDVEGMNCSNNPNLTSIDLRNGADYTEVYQFTATNNPNLTCIFVDDVAYANTNWINIDANTTFVDTEATCTFNNTHTYVPDNNFEQALIDEGLDDVLDNYVPTTNISTIGGTLDVSNKNIADLTGIEDFIELEAFICSNNSLTTLDVSNNHFLEFACDNNQLTSLILNPEARVVDCSNNQLTSLEIPNSMANLDCANNQITSLDFTATTEFSILNCSNNQLTFLDLRNGENTQITDSYNFDARNNPDLTCIFVDDITYSTNTWTNIDATSHFVTTQAECDAASIDYTSVPDDNFEQSLIDLGYDDVLDDQVVTANINTVTALDVANKNIADLTGIEDFTALTILKCNQNTLTSLDVTHNTQLTELVFSNNQITTIDLSQNTVLQRLECSVNQLTALNLSNNTGLKFLECGINQITSIDVSQNTILEEFGIQSNSLTSLDVSHNTNLTNLHFGGIDAASASAISSIDLSNNTQLVNISVEYTQITNLNISHLTNLEVLFADHNQLENLDVSQNTNLVELVCNDNQLYTLNVQNGNNVNFTLFQAQNNSFLSCIQVDDPAWSTANWTSINGAETFSNNCHYFQTYVPDDNFEQALIDLGYDAGALDDYVPTANINTITSLDVSAKNIADLTGINDFDALTYLNCNNNQLTTLDTAGNMHLQILYCGNNQLTTLAFFNNVELTQIYCNDNQLTILDYLYYQTNLNALDCSNNSLTDINLGNNPGLLNLHIEDNNLTTLDVSQNTQITVLGCSGNQLTSLDTSTISGLIILRVETNQLTSLDVSNNPSLSNFRCENNNLTSLDMRSGGNINLADDVHFNATNNSNLTCIFVDDVTWSTANWTNIDATSTFVADEAACTALSTEEYTVDEFKILSNPVFDTIKISILEEAEYRLVDINGKMLKKGKLTIGYNTIDVRTISKGIYFLKVNNTVKSSVKKLIIQ